MMTVSKTQIVLTVIALLGAMQRASSQSLTSQTREVNPKSMSKYLIRGRIWVDAADYAIVRVEGSPAENPSFWTKSVHFVHTYRKVWDFWFAASTTSVTEVRIFGTAELSIKEFGQSPRLSNLHAADLQTASSARP